MQYSKHVKEREKMITIKIWWSSANTTFEGYYEGSCTFEVEDDVWNIMDEEERSRYCEEIYKQKTGIDWGYEEIKKYQEPGLI